MYKGQETNTYTERDFGIWERQTFSYTDHPGLCIEKIMENYNKSPGYFWTYGTINQTYIDKWPIPQKTTQCKKEAQQWYLILSNLKLG